MSGASSSAPLLPNGKILVVGMSIKRNLQFELGGRVLWKNHWEIEHDSAIPEGVTTVILPYAMKPEAMNKMKSWAQSKGVAVLVENTTELLEKRLAAWIRAAPPVQSVSSASNPVSRPVAVQFSSSRARTDGEFRIAVDRVRPLKGQPRTHFSTKAMSELVTSIRAIGQITPIIVRVLDGDPLYEFELIEGERRLRACKVLGLKEILATVRVVKDINDQFKKSFVANFAREGHTPLETARFIKKMMGFPEYAGLNKMAALKVIAALSGKTDIWAYNYLKLLDLPEEVQAMLEPDSSDRTALPQAMGIFLCSIESKEIQLQVCREAVEKKLSVAKAKYLARQLGAKAGVRVGSAGRTPKADYNILRTCMRKAEEGIEYILTMPHRTVEELFQNRELEDRQATLRSIDSLMEHLSRLRSEIDLRSTARKRV